MLTSLLFSSLKAAAAAKSLQSCPTLCDPWDGSPPGSPVPGILQARTVEWVAVSFSNAWKWKVKVKSLSRVRLLATPCTAAYQAPPSIGFSRQEYWSGVPLPSPFKSYFCYLNVHQDNVILNSYTEQVFQDIPFIAWATHISACLSHWEDLDAEIDHFNIFLTESRETNSRNYSLVSQDTERRNHLSQDDL